MKFEITKDGNNRITATIDLNDDNQKMSGCCPEHILVRRNGALIGRILFNVPECQGDWEEKLQKAERILAFPRQLQGILKEFYSSEKYRSKAATQLLVEGFIEVLKEIGGKPVPYGVAADWPREKLAGAKLAHDLHSICMMAREAAN